jgi:hypothetical protein
MIALSHFFTLVSALTLNPSPAGEGLASVGEMEFVGDAGRGES